MEDFDTNMTNGAVHRLPGLLPEKPVNVGPFHCSNLPDDVRGGTVGRDNIPVIMYESRIKKDEKGECKKEEKWAVMMPPVKSVGIVCAGCYVPEMTLWNNSRCVSCRTFANHMDIKEDGSRKRKCLALGDNSLPNVTAKVGGTEAGKLPVTATANKVNLEGVPACDLLQALKGTLGLTAEHTDAVLAEIPDGDMLYTLGRRHEDGLAGYLPHIDFTDIKAYVAYVTKNDKAERARRALKKLR
jgi:hypothetical protein